MGILRQFIFLPYHLSTQSKWNQSHIVTRTTRRREASFFCKTCQNVGVGQQDDVVDENQAIHCIAEYDEN